MNRTPPMNHAVPMLVALVLVAALAACETRGGGSTGSSSSRDSARSEFPVDPDYRENPGDAYSARGPGIFGTTGFSVGGPSERQEETGIGVSVYLWRASLDSLSHLPLRSADPFGGLIQTEWYEPLQTPGERLRVDLRINSRVLDAEGVSASVFRQVRLENEWRDSEVSGDTARRLEDVILRRAREIRFAEQTGN
ncbi:MAG: DUF3576 domain-containing protein [Alphaproteobacteria bacterium]|nr:DUF3576 domain-containing protein [Alphaproteobacteria bacterium]MDA8012523.1 DUF3576 domain-containing protein [Alphaproteobacteria bacterium]